MAIHTPQHTPPHRPPHSTTHTAKSRVTRIAAQSVLLLIGVTASCRDVPTAAQLDPALARATPSPVAPSAVVNLAARALAANCFQCHGTDGEAGELKIAGESASEIISKLNGFRARDARRNIMNLHAVAYTSAEVALIADYFAHSGK